MALRHVRAGEFQTSFDYGRVTSLLDHSWNDGYVTGFANFASKFETSFPAVYNYSPAVSATFLDFVHVFQQLGMPSNIVHLLVVWFSFFLGGWLLSKG